MLTRPELDTQLTSPLTLAAAPACLWLLVDRFRGADLVPTLGEHREDMLRPTVTELGKECLEWEGIHE